MGCCGSTQSGDNDRPPSSAAAQPETAQPVATSLVASPSTRTRASLPFQNGPPAQSQSLPRSRNHIRHPSGASLRTRTTGNLPSHERYNTPLRPSPAWNSTARTWTPQQLHRERDEFFDTRVTARPEIWGALHNVCELVRGGDVATAQGMLDAAGITLPTGNLVDGCYDEAGNLYRLPELVVSDPVNMRKDGAAGAGEEGAEAVVVAEEAEEFRRDDRSRNSNNIDGETMIGFTEPKIVRAAVEKVVDGEEKDIEKEGEEILERRREEKGKRSERDAVKVRCRLSDRGGPDVVIAMGKTQHVSTLVRRVQLEGHVSPSSRIRLAYLGKILSERDTLEAQGWKEGHVVNALVVGGVDVPGP